MRVQEKRLDARMSKRLEWPAPEFVSQECLRIGYVDGWPAWPFLPMKNLKDLEPGGYRKIGYLVHGISEFPGKVVVHVGICPIFGVEESKLTVEFPSLRAAVEAGWVGD